MVIPAGLGGVYLFTANIVYPSTALGAHWMTININSGARYYSFAGATGSAYQAGCIAINLADGNSISVQTRHNNGSAMNVTARFEIYRLPDEQGFGKNLLTSDKTRFVRNVRIWQQAPHLAAIAPTAGWVFAAMWSCSQLQNRDPLTPLTCPALLFIAASDQVVSNEAIREFARNAPGAAIVVINGALHDLLSEADIYRDQFFAALDAFLADRLRDVPAG